MASIGSIGDSYHNSQAEWLIGLYKNEMVKREGPWRGVDDLELATLNCVHWRNNNRLHSTPVTPCERGHFVTPGSPTPLAPLVP